MKTIYLLETEIKKNISIQQGLTSVFGLGVSNIKILIKKLGFSKNFKIIDLTPVQTHYLKSTISNSKILINLDLKKITLNLKKNLRRLSIKQNKTKLLWHITQTNGAKSKSKFIKTKKF
jgi:ribosomal protein S13